MVRTTPPPPLHIAELFPDLGPRARLAVRLHPRAGTPATTTALLAVPC
jgi:hypothetical protein